MKKMVLGLFVLSFCSLTWGQEIPNPLDFLELQDPNLTMEVTPERFLSLKGSPGVDSLGGFYVEIHGIQSSPGCQPPEGFLPVGIGRINRDGEIHGILAFHFFTQGGGVEILGFDSFQGELYVKATTLSCLSGDLERRSIPIRISGLPSLRNALKGMRGR